MPFSDCQRSHFAQMQSGFKHEEEERKQRAHPFMDGKFLEIKRSKFELDPGSNSGQPTVWSITHGVFFFGVGEDAFYRL